MGARRPGRTKASESVFGDASAFESRFARSGVPGNQLLALIAADIREGLRVHLRRVALRTGQYLFRANEAIQSGYFPESGVVSLLARSAAGETLEVGLVGRDGMVGVALLPGLNMLPYDATVQIGGTALRIGARELAEAVRQSSSMHQLLGRYAYTVFGNGVQTSVCNNFHQVRERCARWLLMLHDLAEGNRFPLTHNLLALMLGVRRPSVTLAAHALQEQGLIEYHHGHVTVVNRRGLAAASCECYRLVRDEQRRLLGY